MRILVVEDEDILRGQLVDELARKGYAVDTAVNGEDAAFLGEENPYDLAIVDIGLPVMDGLQVVKHWRALKIGFPILILTARGHWKDKVDGLEAGADDYLVKPFHLAELIARINALLRRNSGFSSSIVEAGPLIVDIGAKTLTLHGEALELTAFEYNTLEYLIKKAGQAVSKSELTEHLYAQDFERDSNVIEVFIGRLRKKLDPDGSTKPISTLERSGLPVQLACSKNHLMSMSLRARAGLFALLLPTFLLASGMVLQFANRQSLENAHLERLSAYIYNLLAVAEPEDNGLWMPEELSIAPFNQIQSGLMAVVIQPGGQTLWASKSALGAAPAETQYQVAAQPGEMVSGWTDDWKAPACD